MPTGEKLSTKSFYHQHLLSWRVERPFEQPGVPTRAKYKTFDGLARAKSHTRDMALTNTQSTEAVLHCKSYLVHSAYLW